MKRKEIFFRDAFSSIKHVLNGRIYYSKCFLDKLCRLPPPPPPPPPKKKKKKKKQKKKKNNNKIKNKKNNNKKAEKKHTKK